MLVEEQQFFKIAHRSLKGFRIKFYAYTIIVMLIHSFFSSSLFTLYPQKNFVTFINCIIFGPMTLAIFICLLRHVRKQSTGLLLATAHAYSCYWQLLILFICTYFPFQLMQLNHWDASLPYISGIIPIGRFFLTIYMFFLFCLTALCLVDPDQRPQLFKSLKKVILFQRDHSKFMFRVVILFIIYSVSTLYIIECFGMMYFYGSRYFDADPNKMFEFRSYLTLFLSIYFFPTIFSIITHIYLLMKHTLFCNFQNPSLHD